jgi:hypothetical protein
MVFGALALVAAAPGMAHAADPTVVRTGDRILDAASRSVLSYEGTANIASFQQDGLLTYRGFQYTAWYRADKRVTLARRPINGDGAWKSIELDEFLQVDDSHNTIAMAFSPNDGRLHVALGTHGTAIRYVRSVPGLGDGDAAWSSTSFEATRNDLPGAPESPGTWTYPMFEMVKGHLMLTWRDGITNNGRQVLARYDNRADGSWSYLGQFTSGEGTYVSPFGTSNSRYGYLHGFGANPVTGDLEIAFSWREENKAWCNPNGLGNHDLGYARSPDGGLTWKNNAGAQIGATGTSDQIDITDDHVVVPIAIDRGLINQEAQTFDREGRIHVMTSEFNDADYAAVGCHDETYPDRLAYARPFHQWRDADGTWHRFELPFRSGSAGRTKLLFDKHDSAYLVLPDGRIAVATAAAEWKDWKVVFDGEDVDNIAELIIDRQRLDVDGVLSVAYQEKSATKDAPSAFRVADFSTDPGTAEGAKATTPEALPQPYAGSAPSEPRATATASSAQANNPASLAVDGNADTFWVSNGTTDGAGPRPGRPETLTIELPKTQNVHEIVVRPREVRFGPRAFGIEARVDGEWKRLADVTQGRQTTTHTVPLTRTNAIRLVITQSWDDQRTPENARNVQVAEVALKTSDRAAPSSQASVAGTAGPELAVGWSAEDASPSWGLERVDLYAKGPRDAAFSRVSSVATTETSGRIPFVASQGTGEYAFYTRATDAAGNVEDAPAGADAVTRVTVPGGPGGPTPPVPGPGPKPAVSLRLTAASSARAATLLRSGLLTRVRLNRAGTVRLTLAHGGRTVGTATRVVTRAGTTYRVRLRPSSAGRRALRTIRRGRTVAMVVRAEVRVDGRTTTTKRPLRVKG